MYDAFLTAALTAAVSTVVGSAVSAVIASLIAKKKSKKAMDEVTTARYIAIENGLQSILRAEIIRQHEKHTERHYCPLYAKRSHGQGVRRLSCPGRQWYDDQIL